MNIHHILVTFDVQNNGTDFNDLQPSNIQDISVTLDVSNNGTDFNVILMLNCFRTFETCQ